MKLKKHPRPDRTPRDSQQAEGTEEKKPLTMEEALVIKLKSRQKMREGVLKRLKNQSELTGTKTRNFDKSVMEIASLHEEMLSPMILDMVNLVKKVGVNRGETYELAANLRLLIEILVKKGLVTKEDFEEALKDVEKRQAAEETPVEEVAAETPVVTEEPPAAE